jgi:hypothetical protein
MHIWLVQGWTPGTSTATHEHTVPSVWWEKDELGQLLYWEAGSLDSYGSYAVLYLRAAELEGHAEPEPGVAIWGQDKMSQQRKKAF